MPSGFPVTLLRLLQWFSWLILTEFSAYIWYFPGFLLLTMRIIIWLDILIKIVCNFCLVYAVVGLIPKLDFSDLTRNFNIWSYLLLLRLFYLLVSILSHSFGVNIIWWGFTTPFYSTAVLWMLHCLEIVSIWFWHGILMQLSETRCQTVSSRATTHPWTGRLLLLPICVCLYFFKACSLWRYDSVQFWNCKTWVPTRFVLYSNPIPLHLLLTFFVIILIAIRSQIFVNIICFDITLKHLLASIVKLGRFIFQMVANVLSDFGSQISSCTLQTGWNNSLVSHIGANTWCFILKLLSTSANHYIIILV